MSVDLGLAATLRGRDREAEGRPALKPKQILTAAAELHERSGLKATPLLEQGDPKRVIVEQAERWQADTIFLGATGHGRLHRLMLGSVAAAVAARAHCSVEVVRRPKDGATLPQ
jgi:nucleotide-binding universal stress UspA family protein